MATGLTAGIGGNYIAWLQSIVRRDEGDAGDRDSGLRAKLMKLFNGPLIDGVYFIETNSGLRYYLPNEEDFSKKTSPRLSYLVGFAGETKSKTFQSTNLKFDHTRPALQSELAKTVRGKLPVVPFEDWDSYTRNLADTIFHDKRLDPCLRHFLLTRTLENCSAVYTSEDRVAWGPCQAEGRKIDPTEMDGPGRRRAQTVRTRRTALGLVSSGDDDLIEPWHHAAE